MANGSEIALLVSRLSQLVDVGPVVKMRAAFDRFLAEYLADPTVSDSAKEWRSRYVRYLRPLCEDMSCSDSFRAVAVEAYRLWPRATASMVCNTLGRVLTLAREWGMRRDPHDLGRLAQVWSGHRDRVLSKEERLGLSQACDKLIETPYGSGRRGGVLPGAIAAIRLLVLTGMRCSEVAAMRWEHVRDRSVWLPDSKVGPRRVLLGDDAWELARSLPRVGPFCCPGKRPSRHVSTICVWSTLKRACAIAGIENVSPHTMRHTFATEAVLAGVPLNVVAAAMGWATDRMIKVYAHIKGDHVREACTKVGMILRGVP